MKVAKAESGEGKVESGSDVSSADLARRPMVQQDREMVQMFCLTLALNGR